MDPWSTSHSTSRMARSGLLLAKSIQVEFQAGASLDKRELICYIVIQSGFLRRLPHGQCTAVGAAIHGLGVKRTGLLHRSLGGSRRMQQLYNVIANAAEALIAGCPTPDSPNAGTSSARSPSQSRQRSGFNRSTWNSQAHRLTGSETMKRLQVAISPGLDSRLKVRMM